MFALLSSTSSLVSITLFFKCYLMYFFCADTAFMFVMGGLFTVKVLQSRHPDINAAAYIAFFCFAVVILLTLMGIVSQTPQACICIVIASISCPNKFSPLCHNTHNHVFSSLCIGFASISHS